MGRETGTRGGASVFADCGDATALLRKDYRGAGTGEIGNLAAGTAVGQALAVGGCLIVVLGALAAVDGVSPGKK